MKLAKSHVFWSSLTQLGGRCDCDSVQRETRKLDVHFRRENQHVRSTHFWKKKFFCVWRITAAWRHLSNIATIQ